MIKLISFQDIHYMALEHNESALAELAKRKAESLSSGSPATGRSDNNVRLVSVSFTNSYCFF